MAACGADDPVPEVEPLAPLPPPAPAMTERFTDAEACAQCHLVPDGAPALHDATGANVSPVLLWRASMMALAARDPYYLAVFAEELERAPDRRTEIEALCTRCHAPAGNEELGGALGFDELTAGDSPAARLGRGGVTCSLCHQIDPANLGAERSFSGGFAVGYGRQMFGPYLNPLTDPMQQFVRFTPTRGAHIGSAELCGTCHTVVVPGVAGDILEQATYLEWRASSYAADRPCQVCHVPTTDDTGRGITTPIAGFPTGLGARTPFGRHLFIGGNAYMLTLMADAIDWLGAGVDAAELLANAARSEAHLRTAAELAIARVDAGAFTVQVINRTGHKLPTGYPSRRMWLHVRVEAAGAVIFESGAPGTLPARSPHFDDIRTPGDAPVWEAVLVDAVGEPTHRTLDARRFAKDNRILPEGFAPSGQDRTRLEPVGVINDPSFVPGRDAVTYRVAVPAGATVTAELLYQTLRPETIDAIAATPTPAGRRFVDLARARPVTPIAMARVTQTL